MWSEGCICCSPETVQKTSAHTVLAGTPSMKEDITYVSCENCNCKVCSHCVMGLTGLVSASNKTIPQEDPSILALKSMELALKNMDEPKVDFGFCCSFKQDINVPIDLMHVGHHFDDVPRNVLVQHRYTLDLCEDVLPREELHNFVASGHWARPSLHRGK